MNVKVPHGWFQYCCQVLLADVVSTWDVIRATRSRLAKVAAMTALLEQCDGDDARLVVTYLSGELPQGRIGLGYSTVGSVERPPATESCLVLSEIDETLTAIKTAKGAGSKAAKESLLGDLLAKATETEQEFVQRLLLGGLRQGALAGIMTDAVAQASGVDIALVRRAAMVSGELPLVATAALAHGAGALETFALKLFTPVQPMLAQSAPDVAAAIAKLGAETPASIEWKVDGARVQVHRSGQQVRVFTRNLRDITNASPDIVGLVMALDCSSIILDGEAILFRSDGRPEAFQDTISGFSSDRDGALAALFFDCLHLDGVDLIDREAQDRRHALESALPQELVIPRVVTSDPVVAQEFFDETIEAGHEGVMVKSLDSSYAAGRRGKTWIKVKPVHTLDLVVLAVEWGSGRRVGLLSNLHLGARDPDNPGKFIMLGKTFKGLTDELLRWQTARFLDLETDRTGRGGHIVQVRPEQVVEIAVDGVQRSTRYPGGVALRFARVRQYRNDKAASEADTIDTVRTLFGSLS